MKIRLKEGGGRGNEMGDIKSCHHFISLQLDCLTNILSQTSQRTKINKVTDLLICCVVMINCTNMVLTFG
jgi:hypothetical protein